ncbi:hypothetical protein JW949_03190 [Candidatus Woesearchaeota archaeon]|nr:hypothetical protein [Candidatus Woesearchaeota archaeon]
MKFLKLRRKSQAAVEYLTIVGVAFAIIFPAAILFYNYSQTSNIEVMESQINVVGNKILDRAEAMYSLGEGSWVQLEANIPDIVNNIYFIPKEEMVVAYKTQQGVEETVFFTDLNITTPYNFTDSGVVLYNISDDFHTGLIKVKIESRGDYLVIQLI